MLQEHVLDTEFSVENIIEQMLVSRQPRLD